MMQLLRFLIVGAANTLLGYIVIFGCMFMAEFSPELSNALGYMLGFFSSYFLNRYYTFRSNQKRVSEFSRFALVFLIAYLCNIIVVILLYRFFNIDAIISQIIAAIVYISMSYILNKIFVFRTNNENASQIKLAANNQENCPVPLIQERPNPISRGQPCNSLPRTGRDNSTLVLNQRGEN
jgi:putative flippase GtrA